MCPVSLAEQIAVKDIVLVKSGGGLGIVRVDAIHEKSQATGPYNYRWAFQRVDTLLISELEKAQADKQTDEAASVNAALEKRGVPSPEKFQVPSVAKL